MSEPNAREKLLEAWQKISGAVEDPALLDLVIAAGATFSRQGKTNTAEMYNRLRIDLLTVSGIDFPALLSAALQEAREEQRRSDCAAVCPICRKFGPAMEGPNTGWHHAIGDTVYPCQGAAILRGTEPGSGGERAKDAHNDVAVYPKRGSTEPERGGEEKR